MHSVLVIPEIILLIGNCLSRRSVATCARICKLWHMLLIPLLYQTIDCMDPRIVPIDELAKNARHIRNLSVRLYETCNLIEDGISVFSSRATIRCRNLRALTVTVYDDRDGKSCCEALILLNQQLRELRVHIVSRNLEVQLSWRVVFSQCSPFLQSLTLESCHPNKQETAQLMEIGQRLKSLDLFFCECVWSEFTTEPQFPVMTCLKISQMFRSPEQELSWFTQCPRLREICWNRHTNTEFNPRSTVSRPAFSILHFRPWKHLQQPELNSSNLSDSQLARILTTSGRLRAISITKSGFWYRSLAALQKHSETLERLRLYDGDGLHSWMCQWIATSFPKLKTLKLGRVFAHELVEDPSAQDARTKQVAKNTIDDDLMLQNDLATGDDEAMNVLIAARARFTASHVAQRAKPWVCLKLEQLTICFTLPLRQSITKWDKQVFQQISKLVCLESLNLGQSVDIDRQIHGVNSRGLQLKLPAGLTLLAPLKRLTSLKFAGTKQNMDEQDLRWILNHLSG